MPLITLKVMKDEFTPERKGQLIGVLTDALVSELGDGARPVTWVLVEEMESGDWGIGGRPRTLDDVRSAS